MGDTPSSFRRPAHLVLLDMLSKACLEAVRPLEPEADFEGVVRELRIMRVMWAIEALMAIVIPDKQGADLRSRIIAIKTSLESTAGGARSTFANEIRVIASALDVLLDTLPQAAATTTV